MIRCQLFNIVLGEMRHNSRAVFPKLNTSHFVGLECRMNVYIEEPVSDNVFMLWFCDIIISKRYMLTFTKQHHDVNEWDGTN
jgi:hypothetical protein